MKTLLIAFLLRGNGRLAPRIIRSTIIVSSLITLIVSLLELSHEFSSQRSAVERQLDGISVLLPSIAESVWTYDEQQIGLVLKALTSMPFIETASITTPEQRTWSLGAPTASHTISRIYPLDRDTRGGRERLAELSIVAGIDSIYLSVLALTAEILLGNGVKTLLVAGFMAWLIHLLITSRLAPLKQEVQSMFAGSDEPGGIAGVDEIEALRSSFASMNARLRQAVGAMKRAEAELQSTNRDLDARVREKTALLEASKAEAEAAAETALKAMAEQRNFLAMVSHEFRGPLSTMTGAAQLISLYGQGNPLMEEELAKIQRALGRLSGLINDYLNEERLDSSHGALNRQSLDLGSLVREVCTSENFASAHTAMAVDMDSPVEITGDRNLIGIAISNVIDNALKFSPDSSPLDITLRRRPEGAELSIRDQGPGVPPDETERIFEKYFRSTKSDRVCGVGLGLYLVRRIMELHGGTVSVACPAGGGAIFTLRFPFL